MSFFDLSYIEKRIHHIMLIQKKTHTEIYRGIKLIFQIDRYFTRMQQSPSVSCNSRFCQFLQNFELKLQLITKKLKYIQKIKI